MIVPCPSCDTGNDVPGASFSPAGAAIVCSWCSHEWIEVSAMDRSQVPQQLAASPDIRHLMLAARQAREGFDTKRRHRQMRAAAWAGLLMFALSPLLAALAFPERIVAAAPASISFYGLLGREVNIHGLDIRKLTVEHRNAGGTPVISVRGDLINISGAARTPHMLRVSLRDESGAEVQSWQFHAGAKPLKPGESSHFETKLSSPPDTARQVEIRFAQADEIGSNTAP